MHPPSAPPSPGLLPSRSLLLAVPTLNLLSSSSCHRPSRSNVGCFAYRSHECIARRLNSKYVIERPRTKPNPGCVHGFWIAAVILSNDLLPPIASPCTTVRIPFTDEHVSVIPNRLPKFEDTCSLFRIHGCDSVLLPRDWGAFAEIK